MSILRYYVRWLGSSLLLLASVIAVMFVLLELTPGDPIQSLVGNMPVTDQMRETLTREYGLDQPLAGRFGAYVTNIATGNLCCSFANETPIGPLVFDRLGNTLLITVPALILSSIGGVLIGAWAARTRSRVLANALSIAAIAGFSVPTFWLGLVLILIFSVWLGVLPAQGMSSFTSTGLSIQHMILPVLTLTCAEMAFKVRLMRSSMIEVLGQDYIDTARSKGLRGSRL